jgi:hypothetical protein
MMPIVGMKEVTMSGPFQRLIDFIVCSMFGRPPRMRSRGSLARVRRGWLDSRNPDLGAS